MRNSFSKWLVAVVLAAALLVAASATASSVQKKALFTVKVAVSPSMTSLPFYTADAKGYFAKQGLKIEYTVSTAVTLLMVTGDANIGLTSVDGAFVDASVGKPTPIIAILNQHNTVAMIARTDLNISKQPYPLNVKQLPKKFIFGTSSRSGGGEAFMQRVLGGAGFKEGSDYSVVSLGTQGNIYAALAAKRADVVNLVGPTDQLAVQSGAGQFLVQEAKGQGPAEILPRYGTAVETNVDFAAKNPGIIKKIVAGLVQGMNYVHKKGVQNELVGIVEKYTGLSEGANPGVSAAIKADLPDYIRLTQPMANCGRLSAHGRLLFSIGTINTLPACKDLMLAKYVPKKL
jgi:NitT/TauT family transport system substrate-binding protein